MELDLRSHGVKLLEVVECYIKRIVIRIHYDLNIEE